MLDLTSCHIMQNIKFIVSFIRRDCNLYKMKKYSDFAIACTQPSNFDSTTCTLWFFVICRPKNIFIFEFSRIKYVSY